MLSNDTVISLLNACFVPVYVSGEDYGPKGSASPEEKKAHERIYHAALEKKLSAGNVCSYFCTPDGDPIDCIIAGQTSREKMIETLKAVVQKLGTPSGKTLVAPRPQNALSPSQVKPDSLALHLVVRENQANKWQSFPAENWLIFAKSDWTKFLPPAGTTSSGTGWQVDPDVSKKLLTFFYPGTEDTHSDQVDRNVIERATIQAKVVSATCIRLEASLKMLRPFYPGHPEHKPVPVEATAVGFVEIDPAKPSIRSFRMATDKATFGGNSIGIAVSSHP